MSHLNLITENILDNWVRAQARDAQGTTVELVWRLVCASSPSSRRRFPLGDSINQHGPDGHLITDIATDPFFPEGQSFWEIGTGLNAAIKATSDYDDLTGSTPEHVRKNSAFIFVTPLSGSRTFPNTWKEDAQLAWLQDRNGRNDWQEVRVIDGTKLIDWIHHYPAIELWLAKKIGTLAGDAESISQRWNLLRSFGDPPPLSHKVFTADREDACQKLNELFDGSVRQLQIETHFPNHVPDFVAAHIQALDEDKRLEIEGLTIIVDSPASWKSLCNNPTPLIMVSNFDIHEDSEWAINIQRAKNGGHAAIYASPPGGIPTIGRATLNKARSHAMRMALEESGYNQSRAEMLSRKSNGNLNTLLRLIQNLSEIPEWAQSTDAAEFAISQLIGEWIENSEADREAIEKITGKPYGEWIVAVNRLSQLPDAPLVFKDGIWRNRSRYEAWHALAPRITSADLEKFKALAIQILTERHPKFDLDPDNRYAFSIYEKDTRHSGRLREAIAESLAIIGSYPQSLTRASNPQYIATEVIRTIFQNSDWLLWASLNSLLPNLAEAAPNAFLDAVFESLADQSNPFAEVFRQQNIGDRILGGECYVSGLLWGLETLAWHPDYFMRTCQALAKLAAIDPGGRYGNNPLNSLKTILLPWLPQTCVDIPLRIAAVKMICEMDTTIGWALLESLLPSSHSISSRTRKPAWQEWIPSEWLDRVTHDEYWQQAMPYCEMFVEAACQDTARLLETLRRLRDFPNELQEKILGTLESPLFLSIPEDERAPIWEETLQIANRNRRLSDKEWALPETLTNRLFYLAEKIIPHNPILQNRIYFSGKTLDLFDHIEDFSKQQDAIKSQQNIAVAETYKHGGIQAIVCLSKMTDHPYSVGDALASIGNDEIDRFLIPAFLDSENSHEKMLCAGYISTRFWPDNWQWLDSSITDTGLSSTQVATALSYLPFRLDVWQKAQALLGDKEEEYWVKANVNPYGASSLEHAIERLIAAGRPWRAISCYSPILSQREVFDPHLAIKAITSLGTSSENKGQIDTYATQKLIKALQDLNDPSIEDDLFHAEYTLIRLLDRFSHVKPVTVWKRLSRDPNLFCEAVRILYKSDKQEINNERENSEDHSILANHIWHMLNDWETVPGQTGDNNFDAQLFNYWLSETKRLSVESGHLSVALLQVGHVLIHAPQDPDGLWIHKTIAAALDENDAEYMRDGYSTAEFNSRGTHTFTAGKDERRLAEKYFGRAESLEREGLVNFGKTLRDLAKSYQQDAEREEEKKLFDD